MVSLKNNRSRHSIYLNQSLYLPTLLCVLLLCTCSDVNPEALTLSKIEPVYMTEDEFISSVKMDTSRELVKPGKVISSNGILFVNEINKGIHIIDNTDPVEPVKIGFLTIPANRDLGVKGNFLYADSYSDLLVFNIEDITDPKLVSRRKGVFLNLPILYQNFPYHGADSTKGIVVDWKTVQFTDTCESDDCYIISRRFGVQGALLATNESSIPNKKASEFLEEVSQPMERFAIANSHLYAIDLNSLVTLDISSLEPQVVHKEEVDWGIETIMIYHGYIYLGSRDALYIYSIANPEEPVQVSNYKINNAVRLGIIGNYLFISEGDEGIRIMDVSNPMDLEEVHYTADMSAFGIFPHASVLMISGSSGIVQYDYSNIGEIAYLSTIPIRSRN